MNSNNFGRFFKSFTNYSLALKKPSFYNKELSFLIHHATRYNTTVRPRRAFLYMPANNEKFVKKATTLNVDTLCFDLEDAVAPNQKAEARKHIKNILENYTFGRSEVCIRMNPVSSTLAKDDLVAILSCEKYPNSICVPKVQSADEIQYVSNEIYKQIGDKGKNIEIIGMIETAKAVLDAKAICNADDRLSAIIFGADDYAADVEAVRTPSNNEVWFARNTVLLHAKANDLQAIDIVHINLENQEQFLNEARQGFEMGFTGKQVIHPSQASLAQQAFSPPKDKIEWALRVVHAFEANSSQGIGAFELEGHMIDMPTVRQAQNLVARAKACGLI